MTLHDALTILHIPSLDVLSLADFKQIKRDKIKFLHPDRKKSEEEKAFFNGELSIANEALEIIEKYLKIGRKRECQNKEQYDCTDAGFFYTKRDSGEYWKGEVNKAPWVNVKKDDCKAGLKNRKISASRIVVNYVLCTFVFCLTGPSAFILALLCISLDYIAFKYALACTTKPHRKIGGLIEILVYLNNPKKDNPAPSLYPYSRFVIDMAWLPLLLLVAVFVGSSIPTLPFFVIIGAPFYVIWRLFALFAHSCFCEKKVNDGGKYK